MTALRASKERDSEALMDAFDDEASVRRARAGDVLPNQSSRIAGGSGNRS